jgi:hypothetical protein
LCEKGFGVDEPAEVPAGLHSGLEVEFRVKVEEASNQSSVESSHGPANPQIETADTEHIPEAPLIRPPQNSRRKRKFGDGHACNYDRYTSDGKCTLRHEEHNFYNLLNKRSRFNVYHIAEDCPDDESSVVASLIYIVQNKVKIITMTF